MMGEKPKLLYIIVRDVEGSAGDLSEKKDEEDGGGSGRGGGRRRNGSRTSFGSLRYTRPALQSSLQLIGCKTRHAFKITKRVFDILVQEKYGSMLTEYQGGGELSKRDYLSRNLSDSEIDNGREYSAEDIKRAAEENEAQLKEIARKLYDVQRKRRTIVLDRAEFMNVVCDAMSEYRYFNPNKRFDFALACKIREKRTSMTILLCGTSGCGKSTLSALLASRLGITTVVSTDSIRHMMRSFVDEKDNPLLYASTYSAGEHLDPLAVAEAKIKKLAKKMSGKGISNGWQHENECSIMNMDQDLKGKSQINEPTLVTSTGEVVVNAKTMAIEGYKAQSEMVIDSLDRAISSWEQKCESVIVEGVHLSLDFVIELMKKHPTIIPFMIYIANEEKHLERFAVRAKYMTLDPAKNKYVKYIRNIRAIQDYQCKKAHKYLIPKVNNTNMDQSVASIHATIFACLRRREGGEHYYDEGTNTVKMVDDEYNNQQAANSLGSKGMLQIIRRRGSSRHLMALLNTDGSIAKTWPVEMSRANGGEPTSNADDLEHENECSYEEPLEVKPVNLQFGNFGLSAWQNDAGGTSHGEIIDGLCAKGDIHEYPGSHRGSSRYGSCSSSPRVYEGGEKELLHDNFVSGSDEEQDMIEYDSEEENQEKQPQLETEVEGSVTAGSVASEEDDDYNTVMADLEEYDKDNLNQIGPDISHSFFGNGHKSTIPEQLTPGFDHGEPLTESSRTNVVDENSTRLDHDEIPDEFLTGEEYRKLLHGRSKSLSITFKHRLYQSRMNE